MRADDVIYPSDAGVINVKTVYGAKGDGITDDTNAILNAIRDRAGQYGYGILYFPSGTYLVSKRLDYINKSGWWGAYLTLQGQNRSNTIIRLADNTPGFQDSTNPVAVIYTAAQLGNTTPGDPDYNPDGSGNEGFRNHIMNLTIDIGSQNPGAIAIDYMANNNSRISDVSVISEDGQGVFGINIQRGKPGPLLLKNISIAGFNTAIAVSNSFGVWVEHLSVTGQLVSGVDVTNGSFAVRDFTSSNSVPALRVPNWTGVVSVVDAVLSAGSSSTSAMVLGQTAGLPQVFVRNANCDGYASLINASNAVVPGMSQTEWTSTPSSPLFSTSPANSLNLPVQETPTYNDPDFANWANVVTFGARPNNPTAGLSVFDSSNAIQAAIDSGKDTIYFPPGNYLISKPIHVRGAVRRVLFLNAYLLPLNFQYPSTQPAIQIDSTLQDTVYLENLGLTVNWWIPTAKGYQPLAFGEVNVVNNSPKRVVITNADYIGYSNTPNAQGGTVFLESVFGNSCMMFSGQTVFARNLDPENWSPSAHVGVSGGSLWALGLKIEGPNSSVLTANGSAQVEVLGEASAVFADIPQSIPMVVTNNSNISLAAFRTNPYPEPGGASDYDVVLQEVLGGMTRKLYRSSGGNAPSALPYGYGSSAALYASSQPAPFSDVNPDMYYASAVSMLYDGGITSGCSATSFSYCPDGLITRAQMAIFLVRAIIGSDPAPGSYSSTPYFSDVAPGDFAFASIQKLKELGITGGCGDGVYCPNSTVTRDQMAIFIIRARYGANASFPYPQNPFFVDVGLDQFAFNWIQAARSDGVTSGCAADSYCPGNVVTRGDMALFIMRGLFNQLLPDGMPAIDQVSRAGVRSGGTATLSVTGINTHFVQDATGVVPVGGMTVGAITVLSPTSLSVTISVPAGTAGPLPIWVTTGTETAILPNGLSIR